MTEKKQRLFFALWPDDATRNRIARVARQLDRRQGKPVDVSNLHITLAFMGASSQEQRECYCRAAERVQASGFALTLDSFGYWRRPRVAWLGCSNTPDALLALVKQLNRALTECGFAPDKRRYEAHITLLRKARGVTPPNNFKPLSWTVDRFCLVESVTRQEGVEYLVLQEWLFAG